MYDRLKVVWKSWKSNSKGTERIGRWQTKFNTPLAHVQCNSACHLHIYLWWHPQTDRFLNNFFLRFISCSTGNLVHDTVWGGERQDRPNMHTTCYICSSCQRKQRPSPFCGSTDTSGTHIEALTEKLCLGGLELLEKLSSHNSGADKSNLQVKKQGYMTHECVFVPPK